MQTPEVGADVESICGKCGDVWHVIVAMVEDEIVKVQCKECDAYHKYRAPKGSKAKKKAKAKTKKTKAKTKKTKTPKPPPAPVPEIPADTSTPIVPYAMSESYAPGQRIDHPKFGEGHVEVATINMIQVFFPEKRRNLIHGRT